jgi:hypothetical protein
MVEEVSGLVKTQLNALFLPSRFGIVFVHSNKVLVMSTPARTMETGY